MRLDSIVRKVAEFATFVVLTFLMTIIMMWAIFGIYLVLSGGVT